MVKDSYEGLAYLKDENVKFGDVMRAEEKSLGAQGFDAEIASAEEFRQLMVRDSARWAELIKAQGIKAD